MLILRFSFDVREVFFKSIDRFLCLGQWSCTLIYQTRIGFCQLLANVYIVSPFFSPKFVSLNSKLQKLFYDYGFYGVILVDTRSQTTKYYLSNWYGHSIWELTIKSRSKQWVFLLWHCWSHRAMSSSFFALESTKQAYCHCSNLGRTCTNQKKNKTPQA
jgi:hypothetical protein